MPKLHENPKVSQRLYDARLKNAHRVARRMMELQEQGYLLFDTDNEVIHSVFIDDKGSVLFGDGYGGVVIFWADRGFDNGAFTPIADWNAEYGNVRVVHPRDIKWMKI